MKRITLAAVAIIVASTLVVGLLPGPIRAGGGVQFWVGPAVQNVTQGSTFDVAINLTTFGLDVDTVSVAMTYPGARLSCVNVRGTSDFSLRPQPDSCSGGNVLIQRGRTSNHAGDGMVAIITFQVLATGLAHVDITTSTQALSGGVDVAYITAPGDYQGITGPMTYSSSYSGQSAYPTIPHGSSADSYLQYKNTGNQAWYDDTSAASNSAKPVHLASSRPINRFSLVGTWWAGGQNRPTVTPGGSTRNFQTVYEADGTTLAGDQHVVLPGQIARFGIKFFGPTNLSPGTYREFFQPIVEGGTTMNDPGTFLDVVVIPLTYSSSYSGQSAYPTIPHGSSADSYLQYKNTGNQAWYDDTSAASNSAKPVHLASSRPINRFSLVGTWWAGGQNRPTVTPGGSTRNFQTVYEADGTTLAGDQHVVLPGQIARFGIKFFGPTNLSPGTYREFFQPIVEGGTTMNDPGTFLDVVVIP